jgi:uncharacterized membrane protein YeiH
MEHWLGDGVQGIGIAVFALSGALVAARKGMDPFGFVLLATVAAIGGGTLRDLILAVPVFWLREPSSLLICATVGLLTYFIGLRSPGHIGALGRQQLLIWADAIGLAIFTILGAGKALAFGAHPVTAVALGVMTGGFGGIFRDILAGEPPLVLHREIYITASMAGAAIFVATIGVGLPLFAASALGMGSCFVLRALAIRYNWSLKPFPTDE